MTQQTANTQSNCKAVKIGKLTISEELVDLLEQLVYSNQENELKDGIAKHAFWLVRSDISEEFYDDARQVVGYCHKLYNIVSELQKSGNNF